MKAGEIEDLFRIEVDDTAEPFLWSPEEALDYLNDAQNEAARRILAFIDSSTVAVTQVVVPTTGIALLDARVLSVRKVRFVGRTPLRRMTTADMEACFPLWEDAAASTYPEAFIPDWESGKLRFHPKPSAQLTAYLTVVRDALTEMTSRDSTPELAARYHRALRYWMAHRAYLKPDEETYRPEKSAEAAKLFEMEFGPKTRAIDEVWNSREQYEGDGSYA